MEFLVYPAIFDSSTSGFIDKWLRETERPIYDERFGCERCYGGALWWFLLARDDPTFVAEYLGRLYGYQQNGVPLGLGLQVLDEIFKTRGQGSLYAAFTKLSVGLYTAGLIPTPTYRLRARAQVRETKVLAVDGLSMHYVPISVPAGARGLGVGVVSGGGPKPDVTLIVGGPGGRKVKPARDPEGPRTGLRRHLQEREGAQERRPGRDQRPQERRALQGRAPGAVADVGASPGRRLVQPLGHDFFARDVVDVARDLVGCTMLYRGAGGRIVEVEAYDESDPASHSHGGRTQRNAAMFGPPGHAYVYRSYGLHWCVNMVCHAERAAAVLVRALEPTVGLAEMGARRGTLDPRLLCSGPGRLCQALGITGVDDGLPLDEPPFAVLPAATRPGVVRTPRIGITRATDVPWRFHEAASPWLSRRSVRSAER